MISTTQILDLRRSECRIGLPEPVRVALLESISDVHLYPIAAREHAEQAVASFFSRPRSEVVLVGGVDEAIDHFLEFRCDLETLVLRPGFSGFRERLAVHGTTACELAVGPSGEIAERSRVGPRSKVLLSTPHNPWGCAIRSDSLRSVVGAAGASFVDRTYRALESSRTLVEDWLEGPCLVYYYSFSKVPGLAGLRVGAVCADEPFVSWLRARQRYCALSVTTCAGVVASCGPRVMDDQARRLTSIRDRFVAELRGLGYEVPASETSFVLVPAPQELDLCRVLEAAGVLARDGSELGVPGHVRIGVGTQGEMERVLAALPQL